MKTALLVIAAMGSQPGIDFPWRDRGGDGAASNVEYTVLHEDRFLDDGTYTPKQYGVLTNPDMFEKVFSRYTSTQPPAVDFNENRVLLLDMGMRNNAGYELNIDSVRNSDRDSVTVTVTITKAGAYCFVAQPIINPYRFVQINTTKQVLVDEQYEVKDCGRAG